MQWITFNVGVLRWCLIVSLTQQQSQRLASFKQVFAGNQSSVNPVVPSTDQPSLYGSMRLTRSRLSSGSARQFALLRLSDSLDDAFVIVDTMIQYAENPRQRNHLAHLARSLFKAIDACSVLD